MVWTVEEPEVEGVLRTPLLSATSGTHFKVEEILWMLKASDIRVPERTVLVKIQGAELPHQGARMSQNRAWQHSGRQCGDRL